MTVLVTVIIPVYKDWDRLRMCLEALGRQTIGVDNLQILAVNNDPDDDAPPPPMPAFATLLQERKPGSYAARNKAVALAQGDVLAFTDSDCIPADDWLERALEHLKAHPGARVTGPVPIFRVENTGPLVYLYEFHTAFRQKENAAIGVCVTANLIVERETLKTVGWFNDSLMSGGDFEWNRRAQQAGVPLIFSPDVIVRHPSRQSLDEIFQKRKRIARSDATQRYHRTWHYVWNQLRPPLKRLRTGRKFNSPLDVLLLLGVSWSLNIYAAAQFLCVRVGLCSITRS